MIRAVGRVASLGSESSRIPALSVALNVAAGAHGDGLPGLSHPLWRRGSCRVPLPTVESFHTLLRACFRISGRTELRSGSGSTNTSSTIRIQQYDLSTDKDGDRSPVLLGCLRRFSPVPCRRPGAAASPRRGDSLEPRSDDYTSRFGSTLRQPWSACTDPLREISCFTVAVCQSPIAYPSRTHPVPIPRPCLGRVTQSLRTPSGDG